MRFKFTLGLRACQSVIPGPRRQVRAGHRAQAAAPPGRHRPDRAVLTARGLTTGEISAHSPRSTALASGKGTISRITEQVVAEMTDWQARPLDQGRFPLVVANPRPGRVRCREARGTSSPADVKRHYFELIRQGLSGAEAARGVGVSLSCGSLGSSTLGA